MMKAALKTLFSEKQWNTFKEEAHKKRLALITKDDTFKTEILSELNTARNFNKEQYQSSSSSCSSSRQQSQPNISVN